MTAEIFWTHPVDPEAKRYADGDAEYSHSYHLPLPVNLVRGEPIAKGKPSLNLTEPCPVHT